MNLNGRLMNLERTSKALLGDTHEDPGERLLAILEAQALRLEGTQPDENWCRKASKIQIAAMALAEHAIGATTPALWAQVKDLAGPDTAIEKLFAGFEAVHGTD